MLEKERHDFSKNNSSPNTIVGINPWTGKVSQRRNVSREGIFEECMNKIQQTNTLLLELPTGYGKTALSIKLVNHLCSTVYKGKKTRMLLLVAKRVHKQTWRDEFEKWEGVKVDEVVTECYESLHKHIGETFDIVLADEHHHIGSEKRLEELKYIKFTYYIGLSATIPRNLKSYFKYHYHSQIVSCDIVEAIEDDVLPEPEILLFPLKLDNTQNTEQWEINPKAKGPIVKGEYKDKWKFKKEYIHGILSCTQKQKSNEYNAEVLRLKNRFNFTRNEGVKNLWLQQCGHRLEFYSNCKVAIVQEILKHLQKYRTITFCKTIEQCEKLGKNCIHSQNKDADKVYERFNEKKLNHITSVNILNENANLVDCKYAIFCNLSSSDCVVYQRLGRSLRHKNPVIIMPYYTGTREQELIEKLISEFNPNFVKTITSINEI